MNVYDLWLPIVLAGVATHILSTIAWMALPHHKPEWKRLPCEDELQKLLDAKNVPADQYMFPFSRDPKEVQSDKFKRKQAMNRGMLVLWQRPLNMGAAIGKTLAFFFVAAFVIGYLASLGVAEDASFMDVFQFVTTAGLLTHCASQFPGVFWFKQRVLMQLLDGAAFALATGLIFALLWPSP